jgi:ATP phosphoribosyltransferase
VASKYVNIAREHFAAKGVHVDLIKLYGSMELAPLAGLADAIVDLVSTGSTLKANNLIAVEHIMDISSRLIVNQAALKLKREQSWRRFSTPSPESSADDQDQTSGHADADFRHVSTPCSLSKRPRTRPSSERSPPSSPT